MSSSILMPCGSEYVTRVWPATMWCIVRCLDNRRLWSFASGEVTGKVLAVGDERTQGVNCILITLVNDRKGHRYSIPRYPPDVPKASDLQQGILPLSDEAATKLIWPALHNITVKWKNRPTDSTTAKARRTVQFDEQFTLED